MSQIAAQVIEALPPEPRTTADDRGLVFIDADYQGRDWACGREFERVRLQALVAMMQCKMARMERGLGDGESNKVIMARLHEIGIWFNYSPLFRPRSLQAFFFSCRLCMGHQAGPRMCTSAHAYVRIRLAL